MGARIDVPDGTAVLPLFNPLDPANAPGDAPPDAAPFSVAVGEIAPGTRSAIHVLPHGTQLTVVLAGTLTVRMRGARDAAPYTLTLAPDQACLTLPGERLQLENATDAPVRVLYIVAPPYKAETGPDGNIVHEDAVLLDRWDAPPPAA